MEALAESRIVWGLGLVVALSAIRFVQVRFGPRPLEVVSVRIEAREHEVPSENDLKLRETVRNVVADLGLGEAISLRNGKTGREFMSVWLYVPRADAVVPEVARALSAYPVRVRALGPPIDMSSTAMLGRFVPALWRSLVTSWHETRR
jgi:hypothetical protein